MNKVILIGRIGSDIEKRDAGDTCVARFSLATEEYYGGENHTTWHNVEAWGKTAEFCKKHFAKGKPIVIDDAKIKNETWDDKDGVTHYKTVITAYKVSFALTNKNEDSGKSGGFGKRKTKSKQTVESNDIPF